MSDPGAITRAVNAVGVRPEDAAFPPIYEEPRRLAAAHLVRERRPGRRAPIEPTVLLHAACEKLFGKGNPGWENRRHFFGAAANAMRQILIDQARQRKRRREVLLGPHPATALVFGFSEWGPDELLALDEALSDLEKMDRYLSEIVRRRTRRARPALLFLLFAPFEFSVFSGPRIQRHRAPPNRASIGLFPLRALGDLCVHSPPTLPPPEPSNAA